MVMQFQINYNKNINESTLYLRYQWKSGRIDQLTVNYIKLHKEFINFLIL